MTNLSASRTRNASPFGSQDTTAGSSFLSISISFRGNGFVCPVGVVDCEEDDPPPLAAPAPDGGPGDVVGVGAEPAVLSGLGTGWSDAGLCMEWTDGVRESGAPPTAIADP
mmetsp:Transcript_50041/g.150566  ORF Transcript_50041/g.150566 Transcript_50041/m.150566 type:complete len:111 (-) Transcript_50041:1865-2197(-)